MSMLARAACQAFSPAVSWTITDESICWGRELKASSIPSTAAWLAPSLTLIKTTCSIPCWNSCQPQLHHMILHSIDSWLRNDFSIKIIPQEKILDLGVQLENECSFITHEFACTVCSNHLNNSELPRVEGTNIQAQEAGKQLTSPRLKSGSRSSSTSASKSASMIPYNSISSCSVHFRWW